MSESISDFKFEIKDWAGLGARPIVSAIAFSDGGRGMTFEFLEKLARAKVSANEISLAREPFVDLGPRQEPKVQMPQQWWVIP